MLGRERHQLCRLSARDVGIALAPSTVEPNVMAVCPAQLLRHSPVKLLRAGPATKREGRCDEAIFPGIRNPPETKMRSYHLHPIAPMERDMNTAVARFLERSSERTTSSFDGLISVAIFSGMGLLISISVLLLDRYIPGEWF